MPDAGRVSPVAGVIVFEPFSIGNLRKASEVLPSEIDRAPL